MVWGCYPAYGTGKLHNRAGFRYVVNISIAPLEIDLLRIMLTYSILLYQLYIIYIVSEGTFGEPPAYYSCVVCAD